MLSKKTDRSWFRSANVAPLCILRGNRRMETHLRDDSMRVVPSGVWRRAFVRSCVSLLVTEAAPI